MPLNLAPSQSSERFFSLNVIVILQGFLLSLIFFSFVFCSFVFTEPVLQVFLFFSQRLPLNEVRVYRETHKFKLAITEKGTRFYEKVEINEVEQIAYFKVPPHNGLPENEELVDYRMVRYTI